MNHLECAISIFIILFTIFTLLMFFNAIFEFVQIEIWERKMRTRWTQKPKDKL